MTDLPAISAAFGLGACYGLLVTAFLAGMASIALPAALTADAIARLVRQCGARMPVEAPNSPLDGHEQFSGVRGYPEQEARHRAAQEPV